MNRVGAGGGESGADGGRHGQQAQDAGTGSQLATQADQHRGQSDIIVHALTALVNLQGIYRASMGGSKIIGKDVVSIIKI